MLPMANEKQQIAHPANPELVVPETQVPLTIALSQQTTLTHFSGPLPPPALLEEYGRVVPNGAERVFSMAEAQSSHRIEMEKTVISGNLKAAERGQYIAGSLSVLILVAGSMFMLRGYPTQGATIITGNIVALASIFVIGKRTQAKEREAKAKEQASLISKKPPKTNSDKSQITP